MTGQQFERDFCELLKRKDYWALQIPRNRRGAQPFDVLAIKDKEIFAIDCKTSASNLFQLSRVEHNQWSAFKTITNASNGGVKAGLAIFHAGEIYWVDYSELLKLLLDGKSLKITSKYLWFDKAAVKKIMGMELK